MANEITPLDDFDSLGVRHGRRFFNNHQEAWEAVQRWTPLVCGNRHVDWASRDLIRGSALREPANWPYRMLSKSDHPFLEKHNKAQADISRSQAYLYVYYQGLLQQAEASMRDPAITSLISCPPNLYQIEQAKLKNVHNCRRCSRCPFCLARSAFSVFERVDFATRANSQTFLCLISLTDRLAADIANDESEQEALKQLKSKTSARLRMLSRMLGSDGGVVSSQILPRFNAKAKFRDGMLEIDSDAIELTARSALLVPLTERYIAEFMGAFDEDQIFEEISIDNLPVFQNWWHSEAMDEFNGNQPHVFIKHLSAPGRLRGLVMGSTPGMNFEECEDGIEGLFVAPQWHLVPPELMTQFAPNLINFRIYDFFGTWRSTKCPTTPKTKFGDTAYYRQLYAKVPSLGRSST